jgi:hypothetical protein
MVPRGSTRGLSIEHPRKCSYNGQVFYLDSMPESALPKTWSRTAILASGDFPAIQDWGHETEIKDLLKKFHAIGPFRHNITVSWTAQKSQVDQKDP